MSSINDITAAAIAGGHMTQETADRILAIKEDLDAGRISFSDAATAVADLQFNYTDPKDRERDERSRSIIRASAARFAEAERASHDKDTLIERAAKIAEDIAQELRDAGNEYVGGRNPFEDAARINSGPNNDILTAFISEDGAKATILDVSYGREVPDSKNSLRVKAGEIWGGKWPVVTVDYLRGLGACENCQAEFAAQYPDGLTIDPSSLTFNDFKALANVTYTHGTPGLFRTETEEIVAHVEYLLASFDKTAQVDGGFSERAEEAFVEYHDDAYAAVTSLLPLTFAILSAEYGNDKPIVLGVDEGERNAERLENGYISIAFKPEARAGYTQNAPSTSTIQ